MSTTPKVSIVGTTYNHEKYIRQALDGFSMQRTNFDFEVIMADDRSSDKTPAILKEYADAKPEIFKPILRKKNLGVALNFIDALRTAKGQYIAICEGDDYWTDPQKLQLQVDFLDKHSDYALCFHLVKVFFENNEEKDFVYPETRDKAQFTVKELLQHNFIQTNSVMYRRQEYDDMPTDIMPLDIYLHLYHAQFGKIGFIDRTMSAYRRHAGGVWWDSYEGENELWKKYALPHLGLFVALHKLYGSQPDYSPIINTAIDNMFNKLIELDKKYGKNMLEQATRDFPQAAAGFIARQHREKTEEAHNKDQEILKLQQAGSVMEQQIAQKDQKISAIQASRVWKTRNKVAKLRKREVL